MAEIKMKNFIIEIDGKKYKMIGSRLEDICKDLGISEDRFIEILSRDAYCPTLSAAPTSSTLTYVDTDGSTNHFQVGQLCRWAEDDDYRLAVCKDITDTSAAWYMLSTGNSESNVGAVDTDDFVEEPDLAKYLTTKPQSFTDEEKQQVKDNLGISAEDFDLSDYATKEELKGKEDKKILIDHGTDDTTFALTPNVFHKWGEVANLSLTLAEPSDSTAYNEYMFEFVSGSTATTLSLPDTIQWASTPSVEANMTYQVSIVNNIGLIVGV